MPLKVVLFPIIVTDLLITKVLLAIILIFEI